jgi:hypothetical protein
MPVFKHLKPVAVDPRRRPFEARPPHGGGSRSGSRTLRNNIIAWASCCSLILAFAAPSRSSVQSIRRPLGVYAKVDIETALSGFTGPAPLTPAQQHADLRNLFADLLANPAISGITVGQRWDHIQLSDPATTSDLQAATTGASWTTRSRKLKPLKNRSTSSSRPAWTHRPGYWPSCPHVTRS